MLGGGGREAWDLNESAESLAGVVGGVDRRVWRGLAIRGRGHAATRRQRDEDAWLRGFTLGTRGAMGTQPGLRPFVDVAVGLSDATTAVPVRGTTFNYLASIGAGVGDPDGAASARA